MTRRMLLMFALQALCRNGKTVGFVMPTKPCLPLPKNPLQMAPPRPPTASHNDEDMPQNDSFFGAMNDLGYTPQQQFKIVEELVSAGLVEGAPTESGGIAYCLSSQVLRAVTNDFLNQPALIASILMQDFGISPLSAHQTRAALVHENNEQQIQNHILTIQENVTLACEDVRLCMINEKNIPEHTAKMLSNDGVVANAKPLLFKQVVVNPSAKKRKKAASKDDYGLPRNYKRLYPKLANELDDYLNFMTEPRIDSQEDPIRPATAKVYLRHAKLFLGWCIQQYQEHQKNDLPNNVMEQGITIGCAETLSIYDIIPTKEKESAVPILQFILWLRSIRQISVSYEANFLRGLTKFLKYRFRQDTRSDSSYGAKLFDDIACIRELRKLHRDANKRQAVAPRSSEEDRKWLSWPKYLSVVQRAKLDVEELLEEYRNQAKGQLQSANGDGKYSPLQRKIAIAFQKYLILAFFANVPDRQRTIRELEIGRSFIKDEKRNQWCIKHAPEDYKTGKVYGERPPLHLSGSLTNAIDEFLERWRPCLFPSHKKLFVQSRTGQPLTQDSVYQIVSRTCYQYTGQRTNPHLLRDMIVTHVRESRETSEQQLEALALFMGHSIQIQRASYDRRTLGQKVAPALELLESVNANLENVS